MLDRRFFIAGLGSTLIVPAIPSFAMTQGGASKLVNSLVNDINGVIASGKNETEMYQEFERIFERYSDTSYISAYAMGVDGRRATSEQKRAFSNAFHTYIARKYGARFQEFIGGRLEVKKVQRVKTWYEVSTVAYLRNESPLEVTFQVSDRAGKNLFFNMFIEGVNLLLTERTEIGALIDRNGGNIDAMISDLRKTR
jgi:phospholipid transport system substrate-binding protein